MFWLENFLLRVLHFDEYDHSPPEATKFLQILILPSTKAILQPYNFHENQRNLSFHIKVSTISERIMGED